jgi:cyanophycinase
MMSGFVLVQGGDEFSDDCREMDRALLEAAGSGRVAILPAASEDDERAQLTAAQATSYYQSLGVTDIVTVRGEPLEVAAELALARVVVLPGGSPELLLERLTADQGHLSDALRGLLLAGGAINGSSAGAMVLAAATWLPTSDQVVPGLGLLPSSQPLLLLPHADGTPTRWLGLADRAQGVFPALRCLALGERSGVLFGGDQERAFGETFLWE